MRAEPAFDKYEQAGDYHWREYRHNTPYAAHARRVRGWITERRVLDVGGGDGLIAWLLQRKGCEVQVVDTSPLAVGYARAHGVPAAVGSAYRVRGRWEAVYCGDTLEHLRWPGLALRRFRRVAPILYVATPPKASDGQLHDPRHLTEWTPDGLRAFVERQGWRQISSDVAHARILAKFTRAPLSWGRRCLTAIWPFR
ncbi:MAG: class I SAM-dependent methyltransferase [Betaproteobacteria bacterium]|nr:class I SAM-dependent methyltransferase [Betaproteobacteria bacterium]